MRICKRQPKFLPVEFADGKMRCSATVNVDRLKPFHERVNAPPEPGPVSDPDLAHPPEKVAEYEAAAL